MSLNQLLLLAPLRSIPMLLVTLCAAVPSQPAEPSLVITSPASRTVVHPGDTLVVTVSAHRSYIHMWVIGEDPIGFSEMRDLPPYKFTIKIPSEIDPGLYSLTASGTKPDGESDDSEFVDIDVERPDVPVSVTVEPSKLEFFTMGGKSALRVIGKYPDGSSVDLTKSEQTTYMSRAPDIVKVSNDGFVTPLAPGSTEIVINGNIIVEVIVRKPRP
jgi:hypothetical protein